jgi:lysyl-tRNA synthetase class 1
MYWADELADQAQGPQVINDSKTPSGTVHVGSLRGVVLHDAIARALRDRGRDVTFLYGVEDMDPMDAQAMLTADSIEREMGRPLYQVPAPEGSSAPSYARHFVDLFLATFGKLGIHPELYWMSDVYGDGRMDPYIGLALDRAAVVRDVYARVSKVQRREDWLPIQVICETCGKVGTTYTTDWDGETIAYECRPDLVTWARGCGASGRVSPFGGRAKLPWNLDWAAQWSLFGVTIEGCGKDLSTKGGSRDRSDAIAREVFEREPPLNVAYEFVNIGGRKMSSSKGQGAAAHQMAELLPAELLRFLFLRHRPAKAFDFDPEGDTIPGLFDEFDRIAAAVAGWPTRGELPPDPDRIFRQSLADPGADASAEAARFRPAFRHLALLLQVPGVDLEARVAAEKGAPLDEVEQAILRERADIARVWLDTLAPERYRIEVHHETVPASAGMLAPEQHEYLARLADAAERETPSSGDTWQDLIFHVAQEHSIPSRVAFEALYAAFLDRENGPRAGWLLASLAPRFVIDRLRAASGIGDTAVGGEPAAASGLPSDNAAAGDDAAPGPDAAAVSA